MLNHLPEDMNEISVNQLAKRLVLRDIESRAHRETAIVTRPCREILETHRVRESSELKEEKP